MSMRCHATPAPRFSDDWDYLSRFGDDVDRRPNPVRLRSQSLPPRSKFDPHSHDWNQLTYATDGVLTVMIDNKCYVVAPGQALWIPTGTLHTTGTVLGATLSSLYVDDSISGPSDCVVFMVSNLLRALIVEVSTFNNETEICYSNLVSELITRQLGKMQSIENALPWPAEGVALAICEYLYKYPSDERNSDEWAEQFKMSKRTLARHFERDTGLSFRVWKHKLRSLKSLEFLANGDSVTKVALTLGYASTSAFTYMFRSEFGICPSLYRKRS